MGSMWKKIRQVTEDKMLFFSNTQTKCLPDGDVVNFSEVRQRLLLFISAECITVIPVDSQDKYECLIWMYSSYSRPLIHSI